MTLGRSLPGRGPQCPPVDVSAHGGQDPYPESGSGGVDSPSEGRHGHPFYLDGGGIRGSNVNEEAGAETAYDGMPDSPPIIFTPSSSSPTDGGSPTGDHFDFDGARFAADDGFLGYSPGMQEPPPAYSEIAADGPSSDRRVPAVNWVRASMNVREPVSSFQRDFRGGSEGGSFDTKSHHPQPMAIGDVHGDGPSSARTRWHNDKEGGCSTGRRRRRKRGGGNTSIFKRVLLLGFSATTLLSLIFWLLLRLQDGSEQPDKPPKFDESTPVDDGNHSSMPDPARRIVVRETSNSISGVYPLYDLLDISTTSGSIAVSIEPKAGNSTAVLRLRTTSGSITLSVAAGDAGPKRVHDSRVETSSGSVRGVLIHGGGGGSTTVSTHSGSINLEIIPTGVGAGDPESFLHTRTTSASTALTLRSPSDGGKVASLSARHVTLGSGSQSIDYPPEWEGTVHATVMGSGSVSVQGHGLHAQRRGRGEVLGRRGGGPGRTVNVNGMGSGSIGFRC